ncbi:MAG: peptidase domain-containing ABC transporter [bacterium]|nr:peptidase domain-containing ABC transporter [bacterium]
MADREPGATLLERFPALRGLRLIRRRRIPFVQQTTATDCGAACIAMVAGYHGKSLSLSEVREATGISRHGTSAVTLLEAGRYFGLRGRGLQIEEIDDLKYLDPGAILHWRFSHFLVLERLVKRGAWVVNPSGGRQFVPRDDLERSFTGVALTFEPGDDFEPEAAKGQGVWPYVRRFLSESGLLVRILVTSAFVHALALAIPLLTGLLVDRIVPRGDLRLLSVLAVGVAGIIGFNLLADLVRSFLLIHLRTRLDARLALEFLDHMVDLPYLFFQLRSAGDLIMRLNSNSTIREMLTSGTLSAVLDGVMVSLYLLLLLAASPKIGLLVALLGILRVGLFLAVRTNIRDLMSVSLQTQAQTRSFEFQLLSGIETLKAGGAEPEAVRIWSRLFVRELNAALDRGRLDAVVNSLLGALRVASPLVILLYGSLLVIRGELSLGTMLALNALAVGFLTPLSTLVTTAFQLQLMGSYLQRIGDVLDAPCENVGGAGQRAPELKGGIALREVTFRYALTAPPAVRELSLELRPGSFVVVVGTSGSGKSTFASLLAGLYLPESGQILYDGADLAELELRSLRSQLGFVPQSPYLFASSIRGNIALTDPGMPLSAVIEAARLACVHDDIMALPMRYQTLLAENGSSLSGGQRQRIALAQALVRRPRVLVLDEATSALDAVTEQRVYANLSAMKCTRVVIAHRLSTVREADLIVVMDAGSIAEQGTHAELMTLRGKYRRLVDAQLDREPETAGGAERAHRELRHEES